MDTIKDEVPNDELPKDEVPKDEVSNEVPNETLHPKKITNYLKTAHKTIFKAIPHGTLLTPNR